MRNLTTEEVDNMAWLLHRAMTASPSVAVAPDSARKAADETDRQVALLKQAMASFPPST